MNDYTLQLANEDQPVDVETIDNITTLNEVCDADHTASGSYSNELKQYVNEVLDAMENMEAKIDSEDSDGYFSQSDEDDVYCNLMTFAKC